MKVWVALNKTVPMHTTRDSGRITLQPDLTIFGAKKRAGNGTQQVFRRGKQE